MRALEFYAGVLILTTNRVGEFDEAFRSRIHVSLYYPRLDEDSTRMIWEVNLRRVKQSREIELDVEEDQIKAFCAKLWAQHADNPGRRWNGRQIKNAFQTAIALANWDFYEHRDNEPSLRGARPVLKASHFEYVAKTSTDFDQYLDEVHCSAKEGAFSEMAAEAHIRKDNQPQARASRVGHNSQTPTRGVHTPVHGSSKSTPITENGIIEEKQASIKKLKRQLALLDHSGFSDDKRADKRWDLQCQLAELNDENDLPADDAVAGASVPADRKVPWA